LKFTQGKLHQVWVPVLNSKLWCCLKFGLYFTKFFSAKYKFDNEFLVGCGAVSMGKQFPTFEHTAIPQNVRDIHPVTWCYNPRGSKLQ